MQRGALLGAEAALDAYRRAGGDPPFADPARDHEAPFEGYYWRFTDPAAGAVVIALCGITRLGERRWGVVALATHPGGEVTSAVVPEAAGDRERFGAWAGPGALRASPRALQVELGEGAALEVEIADAVPWPRRALGASGVAQLVPGLLQYWHPVLLGGTARGLAVVAGRRISLDGASVYAERNWGSEFPPRWWWGQADAFGDDDVCVAFAGGPIRLAGLTAAPTLVCVRAGGRVIALGPPFARVRASAGGGEWAVHARSPGYEVRIEGEDAGSAVRLPVPRADRVAVEPRSHQALAGRLAVSVRRRGRSLLALESRLAGLEHAGDPAGARP